MPSPRILALALTSTLAFSMVPGTAAGDDLPEKGKVEIKSYDVPGSSSPRIVARAVMDMPAKKIWVSSWVSTYMKGVRMRKSPSESGKFAAVTGKPIAVIGESAAEGPACSSAGCCNTC